MRGHSTLSTTSLRSLQQILSDELGRTVSIDETSAIAEGLLGIFDPLLSGEAKSIDLGSNLDHNERHNRRGSLGSTREG
jgi:hypothetical protein